MLDLTIETYRSLPNAEQITAALEYSRQVHAEIEAMEAKKEWEEYERFNRSYYDANVGREEWWD